MNSSVLHNSNCSICDFYGTVILIKTNEDAVKCCINCLKDSIRSIEDSEEEEPLLDNEGKLSQTTLKVKGDSFRCSCGCNVFHFPDKNNLDIYKCNCCDTRYLGSD